MFFNQLNFETLLKISKQKLSPNFETLLNIFKTKTVTSVYSEVGVDTRIRLVSELSTLVIRKLVMVRIITGTDGPTTTPSCELDAISPYKDSQGRGLISAEF